MDRRQSKSIRAPQVRGLQRGSGHQVGFAEFDARFRRRNGAAQPRPGSISPRGSDLVDGMGSQWRPAGGLRADRDPIQRNVVERHRRVRCRPDPRRSDPVLRPRHRSRHAGWVCRRRLHLPCFTLDWHGRLVGRPEPRVGHQLIPDRPQRQPTGGLRRQLDRRPARRALDRNRAVVR